MKSANAPRKPRIGDPAPDFSLQDQEGETWRLAERRGKVVTLVFYPKDGTPVCTKQMCGIRDHWEEYAATGAEVVGISRAQVAAHKKFSAKNKLPQRLLADEHGEVAALFGVKAFWGGAQRAVIVIDAGGVIRYLKKFVPIFRPRDADVIAAVRAAQLQR